MTEIALEQKYREYLNALPLSALRVLGRTKGIPSHCRANKADIVDAVTEILMGRAEPVPNSGRGAPVKQNYLDPAILHSLAEIRRSYEEENERRNVLEVASAEPARGFFDQPVYTGLLEIMQGGYGFVRAYNCQPTNGGDVFISAQLIHALRLREGDYIACNVKPRQKNDSAAIHELLSVNGVPVGQYEKRCQFDALTACYADERINLSEGSDELSLRILDLFSPIGKGQRALIIAPPKAGKTTLLKDIARAVVRHHRDLHLIVLLIDERPEEVTDIRSCVEGAEVVYSTFDELPEHHVKVENYFEHRCKITVFFCLSTPAEDLFRTSSPEVPSGGRKRVQHNSRHHQHRRDNPADPHLSTDFRIQFSQSEPQQNDSDPDGDQPPAGLNHIAEHRPKQTETDKQHHLRQKPGHRKRQRQHKLPLCPPETPQQRQSQHPEHAVTDHPHPDRRLEDPDLRRQSHQMRFRHIRQRIEHQRRRQVSDSLPGEVSPAAPVHSHRRHRADQNRRPLKRIQFLTQNNNRDQGKHNDLQSEILLASMLRSALKNATCPITNTTTQIPTHNQNSAASAPSPRG